jgi:hypothetical protein
MKKLAIVALALLLASSAFAVQVETTIDEEAGTISYTILEDFQVELTALDSVDMGHIAIIFDTYFEDTTEAWFGAVAGYQAEISNSINIEINDVSSTPDIGAFPYGMDFDLVQSRHSLIYSTGPFEWAIGDIMTLTGSVTSLL